MTGETSQQSVMRFLVNASGHQLMSPQIWKMRYQKTSKLTNDRTAEKTGSVGILGECMTFVNRDVYLPSNEGRDLELCRHSIEQTTLNVKQPSPAAFPAAYILNSPQVTVRSSSSELFTVKPATSTETITSSVLIQTQTYDPQPFTAQHQGCL